MNFWSFSNLADVTKGKWLVEPDDLQAEVTGLWHDTRDIKPGQAYLAIKGENFDGHAFIDKAFDAGAALAIVQTEPATSHQPPAPLLCVTDTVKAMQDLARAYRDELKAGGCKVIGIAGSNGKTTTRHLIHHVLTHAGLKGTQSPKSFNNHLGVPLTLLSAKAEDDFVACEIGTNHPGEIDFLSAIARPDIAVITSIGEEHLEFFINLMGVAKEEASIASHVWDNGPVVVDLSRGHLSDLQVQGMMRSEIGERAITPPQVNVYREMPHFVGDHSASNGAFAVAVSKWMRLSEKNARKALLTASPPPHRMNRITLGNDVMILDDCYNANPSSMEKAIFALLRLPERGRRVAILGDMLELGGDAIELHRRVAKNGAKSFPGCAPLGMVVLCGEIACEMVSAFTFNGGTSVSNIVCYPELEDRALSEIAALLEPGDTVLLKASRGMRLERLIPAIERRFGPAGGDEPT